MIKDYKWDYRLTKLKCLEKKDNLIEIWCQKAVIMNAGILTTFEIFFFL